jgi:hypothetical protein
LTLAAAAPPSIIDASESGRLAGHNLPASNSSQRNHVMFRRLTALGLSLALLPLVAWTAADEKVTLVVPGIQ